MSYKPEVTNCGELEYGAAKRADIPALRNRVRHQQYR